MVENFSVCFFITVENDVRLQLRLIKLCLQRQSIYELKM